VLCKQAGNFTLKATATEAGGGKREASAAVTVGEPKLTLTVTGPAKRFVDRPATYLIVVANTGTFPATGVVVEDEVPGPGRFIASSPYQADGRLVRWNLGTLAPGERRLLRLLLQAEKPGTLTNKVTARADRGLSAQAEAVTEFEAALGLVVDVDKSGDPLEVGANGVYTLRVRNLGNAAATLVTLTVIVPDEMQVTEAKGASAARTEGQRVNFEGLATLAPGGEAVYTVAVKALRPGRALRVSVELKSAELGADNPVRVEETTTIYSDQPVPPPMPPAPLPPAPLPPEQPPEK
jgi:uncharacterized repeat protein (TIGR01451 family)